MLQPQEDQVGNPHDGIEEDTSGKETKKGVSNHGDVG